MTAYGNMKGPSRQQMIAWVLEAWKKLPAEVIKKSFKVCALSSNLDGSEDDQITCIKHGPCQSLLPRLQAFHQEEEEEEEEEEEHYCLRRRDGSRRRRTSYFG